MSTRVPFKYDYRDLVDTPEIFEATEIVDAGTGENRLDTEILFFSENFRLNSQADELGVDITGFDFAQKNSRMTTEWGKDVYEAVVITDPTYQTGTIYAFGDIAGSVVFADDPNRLQDQIDQINQGTNYDDIGTFKYFATYKDRPSLLPFAFDNAISQSAYAPLFEEVGHRFNNDHVAAGDTDLSGSSTLFYPTPTPGAYGRSGIPDIEITNVNVAGNTFEFDSVTALGNVRDGTPFLFVSDDGDTLPTTSPQIDSETVYYARMFSTQVILFTTEANAIEDTSNISISAAGSGNFRLTQEGININDAFQYVDIGTADRASDPASIATFNYFVGTDTQNSSFGKVNAIYYTHGNYGAARTSNETRGKTFYEYGYIKAESITPSGEPVSALRYDTGWVANSDWTDALLSVNHGLNAEIPMLNINIYLSPTGSDSDSILVEYVNVTYFGAAGFPTEYHGMTTYNIDDNNFNVQTGSTGVMYNNTSGAGVVLGASSAYYWKVVVTKPNLVTTYYEPQTRTYDTTSGDVDGSGALPSDPIEGQQYSFYNSGTGGNYITNLPGLISLGDSQQITYTWRNSPAIWAYDRNCLIDRVVGGTQVVEKFSGGEMKISGTHTQSISTTVSELGGFRSSTITVTFDEAFLDTNINNQISVQSLQNTVAVYPASLPELTRLRFFYWNANSNGAASRKMVFRSEGSWKDQTGV